MQRSLYAVMNMTKTASALMLLCAAQWVFAQSFNYITPAQLKQRLEADDQPFLLDIQASSKRDNAAGPIRNC